MNKIKETKENLKKFLESSFELLATENLPLANSITKIGIGEALFNLTKSPSFKNLNILGHVILLKSKNENMIQKIKDENRKAYMACFKIESAITYQNVLKVFYENDKKKNLKTINKLDDLDYHTYETEVKDFGEGKYGFLDFKEKEYINPYTGTVVRISNINSYSNVVHKKNTYERDYKITINLSMNSQYDLFYMNKNMINKLKEDFDFNELIKLKAEFVLFHELAHTGLVKLYLDDNADESNSDICSALRVIKNNEMSSDKALKFLDYLIYWRSKEGALEYYSNNEIIENEDRSNPKNIRIHSTQFALLILRDCIKTDYDYLKKLSIEEELIFSSNAAILANSEVNMETFKKRHFDNIKLYEEMLIDKWLDGENTKKHLLLIADYRKSSTEEVANTIKTNIKEKPEAIFDLMTCHMALDDIDSLSGLKSYSYFAISIIKDQINKANETKLPLEVKRNFSESDLLNEIEKNKKSPKP